jgi:hypothetical protein
MIFLCLVIYFTALLFLRLRWVIGFPQRRSKGVKVLAGTRRCSVWSSQRDAPALWLACVLIISAVVYAFHYSASTQALTLLSGAVIGQGVAAWTEFEGKKQKAEGRNDLGALIVFILALLLTLASIWNLNVGHTFRYNGHDRWSGPFGHPNIFGLLMGVGITLVSGMGAIRWISEAEGSKITDVSWKLGVKRCAIATFCLGEAGFMGRGLLHSYSRGAWVATFCGLIYLISQALKNPHFQQIRVIRWICANCVSLVAIIFAIAVLGLWQFQQPQHSVAKRVSPVGIVNDFSWRNRIAAWEGALQIMAEYPRLGAGWNQPEPLYEHFYLPPKLTESSAFQINGYLRLGATLGVPALICFGMYLWLALMPRVPVLRSSANAEYGECVARNSEAGKRQDDCPAPDWLQATCHAGAIVLLVGFWFDGGLFDLATAFTFWILLELGSVRNHETSLS